MKKRIFLYPFGKSFNNIRIFDKNSVFYYYCKLFLVVFLIPFFIFNAIMISYYYKNLSLRSEMNVRTTFSNTSNAISNIMSETESIYLTLLREPALTAFMSAETLEGMGYYYKDINELDEMADNYSDTSTSIKSITIYSKTCNYILSRGKNGYTDAFKDEIWYKNPNDDCQYFFLPCDNGFYLCYNIFGNNTAAGLVVFEINPKIFMPISNQKNSLVLLDIDRNAFFASGDIAKNRITYHDSEKENIYSKNGAFYISCKLNQMYINMKIANSSGHTKALILYALLSLVLTATISLVLAIAVSKKFYAMLDKILLEIGESDFLPDIQSQDEINFIISSLVGMRTKNTSLQEELTTSAYALKQMQIEALQMQFNPHFLFNALNSISMKLTRENGLNSPYSSLIVLLSDILCESLNTSHYMVRISDEITYARKYLDFQKLADSYLFDTVWDIEESVLDCYTVKLSMQPLIENAVKHGIKSLRNETKGIITIRIFADSDNVVFRISNTSLKADNTNLHTINQSLKAGEMPSSKNIGLKNVNKRTKLVFGEQYGCSVSSEGDVFTVEMVIPAIRNL